MTSDSAPTGKPCPFCDWNQTTVIPMGRRLRLRCEGCGASTEAFETVDEAVAAWNKRVSPALSAELETELRAIRERVEAATPGPWSLGGIFFVGAGETKRNVWGATPEGAQSGAVVAPQVSPPDSDFIAHARADVPRLLAIIAELTTHLRTQAHQEEPK